MGLASDLLDRAAAHLWSFVAGGLVHGTILAAITLVLCATLLRRARPALVAALWTVALLKFLVPIGPEVPLSIDGATQSLLGAGASERSVAQVHESAGGQGRAHADPARGQGGASVLEKGAATGLMGLYALCVAYLLLVRLRRQNAALAAARRLPRASAELRSRAEQTARALGMRRAPALRVDPGNGTPRVVGLARPVVVVPAWLADRSTALEAVLAHELAHLRRRDTWVRGAQVITSALFFFWPVVAWVNRRIDCAREMACDQWAVAHGRLGAVSYARLLLNMASRATEAGPGGAHAVALLDRRQQLERRIDRLVARRPSRGLLQPRMGLCTGLALALWTALSLGGASRAHAASPIDAYPECVIDPGLVEQILQDYPEADTDGDGVLTRAEICAHQALMKRRVLDDAFDGMEPGLARDVASWLDPAVDRDGDGVLSESELDQLKTSVATSMKPEELGLDPIEFPGQVCEEAPVSCTESIEPAVP